MATDLNDRLRELVRHAQAGGAPAAWLEETSHAIVALVLDNAELRRALGGPRLNALEKTRRLHEFVEHCERSGYHRGEVAAAARERFAISKSTYYRRRQAAAPNRRRLTAPSNDC